MRTFLTLTHRELTSFFYSWIAYIVVAGAVFLMGESFVGLLKVLQGDSTLMPLREIFVRSEDLWLILLFSAPVITMRLFALEKFTGTFETLMTTPVSDLSVVLAKFSAALILYCIMWLPFLGFVAILRHFTHDTSFLDPGALAGTFLGIFLLGVLYMSLGCFASSLTHNQIVAAMTTFALGLGLFLLSYLSVPMAAHQSWGTATLAYVNLRTYMQDFSEGVVDTRALTFFLTTSAFFLFLTHRVVQSTRWK
jgi:ABC-2 type transport system permease protein